MKNQLFYGDNLDILRDHIADESIDLIYLDPPFNSNRNYNVLFKEKSGQESASQIEAFEDTWKWDENASFAYHELTTTPPVSVATMIAAMRQFIDTNDMMAYLVMMAQRMKELHRVLKSTGSLYLHCDPTASHYLKLLMDAVFGVDSFRNEIVWKRATTVKGNAGQGSRFFGPNTDTILFYTKSSKYTFNPVYTEYREEYINEFYKYVDEEGRRYRLISMIGPGGAAKGNPSYEVMGVTRYWRYSKKKMQELIDTGLVVQSKPGAVPNRKLYLDEGKGVSVQSLWDDVPALAASSAERLGYPTQKPLALLERIIQASSKEGDVVLDPFCGCGTAVAGAQKLGRRWIGIDITHLAVSLIRTRMVDHFGKEIESEIEVVGEPEDLGAAQALFDANPYQFEWWALSLVPAMPGNDKKKGADRGVDGVVYFHVDTSGKPQKAIVQVKGGKVQASVIRDLRGTMTRENAPMAILVTLQQPTSAMRQEAANAGVYETPLGATYPAIQILTIEELLDGKDPRLPRDQATFKKASRITRNQQPSLDLGSR